MAARERFHFAPVLAGHLLTLAPAGPADVDALASAAADPLIWAQHPDRERWRDARFRTWYAGKIGRPGTLVARQRDGGAVVGMSRYSIEGSQADEIEIGSTFLVRACWGGPANAELKGLMLDHVFRFVSRATFNIGEDNRRSARALAKLGGYDTGRRFTIAVDDVPVPHRVYAIDRADWARRPTSPVTRSQAGPIS